MEMLMNFKMVLAGDMWVNLINHFASWISNYGWAIIVFTICLKLVLTPLDIFQRTASQKQTRVMTELKPEMDKLQAKYGNDRAKLNEEQAKLYKKHNVNLGGMCLPMLLSLVVTFVVFFSLFASLRSYGNEKLYSSFASVDQAYIQAESADGATEETIAEAVKEEYNSIQKKNSWLWVKNVWLGDTNTSQFVNFDSYAKYKEKDETFNSEEAKIRYDNIVKIVEGDSAQPNGYYILIVGAVVISFLTQYLSMKLMTPKGQKLTTMNKVMMAILPVSMLMFAINSNVIFTLYIITNSVMSTLISTIITLFTRKKYQNPEVLFKNKNVEVVEYSRNYKK